MIYLIPASLILLLGINPTITGHVIWKWLADLHIAVCMIGALYLSVYLIIYSERSILHEEEGRCFHVWTGGCTESSRGGWRRAPCRIPKQKVVTSGSELCGSREGMFSPGLGTEEVEPLSIRTGIFPHNGPQSLSLA
ncbi:transmembrane protein 220 [Bombina bombina]|uniref:transmembrane protein 220 n=1 Tax=Bombina bombina TaxID=8345 RepID=UPI00235AFE63|nr:transmembrane protein 220 [Bombina bombina]